MIRTTIEHKISSLISQHGRTPLETDIFGNVRIDSKTQETFGEITFPLFSETMNICLVTGNIVAWDPDGTVTVQWKQRFNNGRSKNPEEPEELPKLMKCIMPIPSNPKKSTIYLYKPWTSESVIRVSTNLVVLPSNIYDGRTTVKEALLNSDSTYLYARVPAPSGRKGKIVRVARDQYIRTIGNYAFFRNCNFLTSNGWALNKYKDAILLVPLSTPVFCDEKRRVERSVPSIVDSLQNGGIKREVLLRSLITTLVPYRIGISIISTSEMSVDKDVIDATHHLHDALEKFIDWNKIWKGKYSGMMEGRLESFQKAQQLEGEYRDTTGDILQISELLKQFVSSSGNTQFVEFIRVGQRIGFPDLLPTSLKHISCLFREGYSLLGLFAAIKESNPFHDICDSVGEDAGKWYTEFCTMIDESAGDLRGHLDVLFNLVKDIYKVYMSSKIRGKLCDFYTNFPSLRNKGEVDRMLETVVFDKDVIARWEARGQSTLSD